MRSLKLVKTDVVRSITSSLKPTFPFLVGVVWLVFNTTPTTNEKVCFNEDVMLRESVHSVNTMFFKQQQFFCFC